MTRQPSDAGRFVIAPEIVAADLVDESVLLDMRSKRYFRLNSTASMIWRAIGAGATNGELIDAVCRRFHIDERRASIEIAKAVEDLLGRGLIEARESKTPLELS